MTCCNSNNSLTLLVSNNTKIQALDSTLNQSLVYFKELLLDFEQLHVESENFKTQFQLQKEKCESKTCSSSDELKNVIESKNNILQLLASTLSRLHETKNFNLLNDAFKIICGEVDVPQPDNSLKTSPQTPERYESLADDELLNDVTLNEIEGTPTGRTSPIIQSKVTKNCTAVKASDFRDKKKCPDNWSTPEKKTVKLTYPTPTRTKTGGRLKQARLNLVKVKHTNIVDLTCSPEFTGGLRTVKNENYSAEQPQIKKELTDNDDTILPSPTSGPVNFTLFKTISKASPVKFKKPQLSLKVKSEKQSRLNFEDAENKQMKGDNDLEESINILQHLQTRYNESPKKQTPVKTEPLSEDTTYCETNMSISLLQNFNNLNEVQNKHCSPPKRPLAENKNIANTPPKVTGESTDRKASGVDNAKSFIPKSEEALYKEPTVRKKLEKRALPGWCCDDCKNFYGSLYKDDPVMMARKIEECSKHRGRHNPVRPKTPPNFWNPRWVVPDDTEELNRMNNAT